MNVASPLTRSPSLPWVAPFALFMLWLGIAPLLVIPQPWESLLRVGVIGAALWVCSRGILATLQIKHAAASITLGLAVCALWVAPDVVVPGWREHWLFQNVLTGSLRTSIPASELASPLVLTLRVVRAALLVPVLEELFWRGWLPRVLQQSDWQQVPLGRFTAFTFVATAVLFALEHGPFWDVGLLCGLIYNAWMWKTRSLGDLILVHAVTNGALSAYVLITGRYVYWM